ncbi:hypothetical protein [Xenorhabdus bovienii]|uniref:hypothetical protein n=1 Tax=Xenorhabdus bovienii TaxID=40576 RepID=UPI0023B2766D|nr:hypothetical protein [Xenorhabdus bovienii]
MQKIPSLRFSRAKSAIIGLLSLLFSFPGQTTPEDQQAQKLAELTTQWGQLTQSQSPGEAAKTLAAMFYHLVA